MAEFNIGQCGAGAELLRLLSDFDGEALVATLSARGVPCAPILTVPQALAHAHTQHRGKTVELPG